MSLLRNHCRLAIGLAGFVSLGCGLGILLYNRAMVATALPGHHPSALYFRGGVLLTCVGVALLMAAVIRQVFRVGRS